MTTQGVETLAEFGADKAAIAKRWINELDLSEKYWKKYQTRCVKILARYEDERKEDDRKRKFNIFWSNIETLKPACYARVPSAVVLRRFNDPDPVGRIAAEVLERAVNFSNDAYDFDQILKDVRDEFLILGKGQSWARYVPTFENAEVQTEGVETKTGEEEKSGLGKMLDGVKTAIGMGQKPVAQAQPPAQRIKYEQVVCDHVSYQDWGTNKCRNWCEVRFVWRRVYMNRDALVKRFGAKIGKLVPLDFKPEDCADENLEMFGQAMVYEIWDKPSKKAYWISRAFNSSPLDERDDPLELEDFFPCPKPAFGTTSPRSIIPIPDYVQYQDQHSELDDLTGRIAVLTKALRMVGFYAADEKINMQQVFKEAAENDLIPVDTWAAWMEKGGIKGLIEWVPIEKVEQVLKGLYEARESCKRAIYEICAISDIMRGDTDPDETAAAQGLKSTWGSSRVREKQKEMARFCRDDMRLKGQIIAKKFSIGTIKLMTNYQLLTRAEKQQIEIAMQLHADRQAMKQQAQQPPQPGMPAPPPAQPEAPPVPEDKLKLMELPAWEDIDELFKSDGMRQFRIDIESDATVEPDLMSDKRDATEFATAIGTLFGTALPAVQAAPPLGKIIAETVKYISRRFQIGREMEETIEKTMNEIAGMPAQPPEPEQKGKSPEEMAIEKAKIGVAEQKNAIAQQKLQSDEANSQRDAQTNAAGAKAELDRVAMEERNARMDKMMERMLAFLDRQTRLDEANIDASTRRYEADKAAEAAKSKTNGVSAQ